MKDLLPPRRVIEVGLRARTMELHGRSVHGVGPFFYIGTFGPGRNRIGACGDISSLQALQRRRPGSPGGYRIVRAALFALEHVESQILVLSVRPPRDFGPEEYLSWRPWLQHSWGRFIARRKPCGNFAPAGFGKAVAETIQRILNGLALSTRNSMSREESSAQRP